MRNWAAGSFGQNILWDCNIYTVSEYLLHSACTWKGVEQRQLTLCTCELASWLTWLLTAKMHKSFHLLIQLSIRSSCCQPAVNILLAAQEIQWPMLAFTCPWGWPDHYRLPPYGLIESHVQKHSQALCEIRPCFSLYPLSHIYTINHFCNNWYSSSACNPFIFKCTAKISPFIYNAETAFVVWSHIYNIFLQNFMWKLLFFYTSTEFLNFSSVIKDFF